MTFDDKEQNAIDVALCVAGNFLKEIGETDLAKLNGDDATMFCKILVQTYNGSMANKKNDDLPF